MTTIRLLKSVGKTRGRNSTKEHRSAKLLARWPALKSKLEGMVRRGNGQTETARLAYAVLLVMETGIRVGNEKSAEGFVCNQKYHADYGKVVKTYGLTTLLNQHVRWRDGLRSFRLSFTGKKLVGQELVVTNRTLVRYMTVGPDPDESWLGVTYPRLKKFVKKYVGRQFTPKDIRTARVNQLFVTHWMSGHHKSFNEGTTKSGRRQVFRTCLEQTAATVGHTPAVCKKSYLSCHLQNVILTATPPVTFKEK